MNDAAGTHFPAVRPPVVFWFKVYAGVLCLLYLLLGGFGLVLLGVDPAELEMPSGEARVMGAVFLVLGFLLFAACLLPFLVPPRPWVWVYDLVVICLGLTSACFLVICIPLLIFWLKPEAKAYFGRA